MTEHTHGDEAWDDPEAEDEDDDLTAQSEDPTSPTRGFKDLSEAEEFDEEDD